MASDFSIRHAAHIINTGGIIAYPTDTIYGLGCDPYNPASIDRINRIKQRPADKHFILLAGDIEQLRHLLCIDTAQQRQILDSNTPTSWIVPAADDAPDWLKDEDDAITIRICDHPLVRRLCHRLGHAIISTSANIGGRRPANNSLELHRLFQHSIDKILATQQSLTANPSRIIRLSDNHIIR